MSDHSAAKTDVWPAERAWAWHSDQPWLAGCNFTPSTASNQLEMWQSETFDPETIDLELALAARLGFNTVRVFLHDLLWSSDSSGLLSRFDQFLDIADRHAIRAMPVLFDGVWGNRSVLGPQPDPIPGIHNSTWLQNPAGKALVESAQWPRFEEYAVGVTSRFADDERVLMWDLYNEPGNEGMLSNALPFLESLFDWVRGVAPTQPLTVGIWNWTREFQSLNEFQTANSDIVSFHSYEELRSVERLIVQLESEHRRPLVCTEYMARTMGSKFQTHLPLFKEHRVGAMNWGLVAGRTQTIFPWESERDSVEPKVWFHDIFRADGTPFDSSEVAMIIGTTSATSLESERNFSSDEQ